jgi:beta-galactosidase
LALRYHTTEALNQAWGTVFWSQTYRSFDEIDLPAQTVTEANPAHRLDWRRFASNEVRTFNREQALIIRELSPGRPVTHNFMGFFTEFNHHDVAQDLDIATWDSYPLGFTQNFFLNPTEKVRYARTGHPDIPAFHHDLYRGMCQGRWWVMEQQPGPVNWASWNPAPHNGMVRLWTWQAFAHGAEVVSYFRWRQAPYAQEQMHTGLHRPDRTLDQGGLEASQVGAELAQLAAQGWRLDPSAVTHKVAVVFDYDSLWMAQIQPQGADFNPLELYFRVYSALRQLGLDVDLVAPNQTLQNHTLAVLPAQLHVSDRLAAELRAAAQAGTHLVLGPRFGSKSANLGFPENPEGGALVPPGTLTDLTGFRVERVASIPPGMTRTLTLPGGQPAQAQRWCEDVALAGAEVVAAFDDDGRPALTRHGTVHGALGWLSDNDWVTWLGLCARAAGLPIHHMPQDVRVSQWGDWLIACNFSDQTHNWQPGVEYGSEFQNLLGSTELPPHGLSLWHRQL